MNIRYPLYEGVYRILTLEYGLTISFELISIIKENKKHASKP